MSFDIFINNGIRSYVLDKPVITLNLDDEIGLKDYVSNVAAIGIHDPEELAPTIESVLKDDKIIIKLLKSRENLILKVRIYRMVNLLKELLF